MRLTSAFNLDLPGRPPILGHIQVLTGWGTNEDGNRSVRR